MTAKAKVLLLLLTLSLALSACGLQTGSLSGRETENPAILRPEDPSRLSEIELIQTLILCLNGQMQPQEALTIIPAKQREDLSLSEFTKYITALKAAVNGQVVRFSRLEESAAEPYRTKVINQSPALAGLARNSAYYQLTYRDDSRKDLRFVVAVQELEDQVSGFSGDWVRQTNRMYEFIQLYFSAIDTKDSQALKGLLEQGESQPTSQAMNEALKFKAERTLQYYEGFVVSDVINFTLKTLLPSSAEVEQLAIVSPGDSRKVSRIVEFLGNSSQIQVSEKIPEELDIKDTFVRYDEKILFQVGIDDLPLQSATMQDIIGRPLSSQEESGRRPANGEQYFELKYPGIILHALGRYESDTDWEGVIQNAVLAYSSFSLAGGLMPGMPVSELYRRYPFAKENNYQIKRNDDGRITSLTIQVEQGYITNLTLTSQ